MTHAYDKICLGRAADTLGRMLDYSVHSLHYDITSMMDLFTASGAASSFERGDIRLIAGMSGIELAYEVLERSGIAFQRTQPRYTRTLSAEYWLGYTLALIQWESCSPFSRIMRSFSAPGFISEYGKSRLSFLDGLPLDISAEGRSLAAKAFGAEFASGAAASFISGSADAAASEKDLSRQADNDGNPLRRMRLLNGFSQSGLAAASGIPVRTIQQYEQGQKDLSKARAEYLIALSRALSCDPAILLQE